MSGTFERNVNSDVKKKFRILGALALAVGILGAPYFRNFGSPKIRKNGSAPRWGFPPTGNSRKKKSRSESTRAREKVSGFFPHIITA